MAWLSSYFLLLFLCWLAVLEGVTDYWSEDFDEGKNCKSKDIIDNIKGNKTTELQCVSKQGENLTQAFSECKKDLSSRLVDTCSQTNVDKEKTGDLMYCQSRQQTTCCFHNHKCLESWDVILNTMIQEATDYMEKKNEVLEKIKKNGYSSCIDLGKSLDASKCSEECEKLKASTFGQECEKGGGLFKCCIRRDVRFCHDCRFCCTLAMCSKPGQNSDKAVTTFDETANITLGDGKNKMSAKDNLESVTNHYFVHNYRCLKPSSDPDPQKWGVYVTEHFLNALKQEDLDKKEAFYPLDKNFLNFEDPEVFLQYTGPSHEKMWKDTYGFDFAVKSEKDSEDKEPYNINKCMMYCMEQENGDYANQCRKKQGQFKCCVSQWNITIVSKINSVLLEKKLINSSALSCGGPNNDDCMFCTAVLACAVKDPLGGTVKVEFKTPLEYAHGGNAIERSRYPGVVIEKDYNGSRQELALRVAWCMKQNGCLKGTALEYYTDTSKFLSATTKDEFCELEASDINFAGPKQSPDLYESMEDCKKRDLTNVRVCPQEKLEKVSSEVKKLNEKLAILKKNSRNSKSEKKSKKSKKDKKGKRKKQSKGSRNDKDQKKKSKSKKRSKNKKKKSSDN